MKRTVLFSVPVFVLVLAAAGGGAAKADLVRTFDSITARDIEGAALRGDPLGSSELDRRIVVARTDRGNLAKMLLTAGDDLTINRLTVFRPDGTVLLERDGLTVRGTYSLDLDAAAEGDAGADFWWRVEFEGVERLIPRGKAVFAAIGGSEPTYRSPESEDFAPRCLALLEDPKIAAALVWEAGTGRVLAYRDWPAENKADLRKLLDDMAAGRPFPLFHAPRIVEFQDSISRRDAWLIYLTHAAHSLWVEAQGQVGWRLGALDAEELALLFDSRKLFSLQAESQNYYFLTMGWVTDWNVRSSYDFLRDHDMIKAGPKETVLALAEWARRHLSHIAGNVDFANYNDVFGYPALPPVPLMLAPPPGRKHVTAGCWGTSGFLAALLRSVNIPVRHGESVFGYSGREGIRHSRAEFPSLGLGLAHSDDLYNQYVVPSGDAVPVERLFVPLSWLKDRIDAPKDLDCEGTHCNTKAEQASFNHESFLLGLGVETLSDRLLVERAKAPDANSPSPGLSNELVAPDIEGKPAPFARPYLAPAEREDVLRRLDEKLRRIGGGDWARGAEIVRARWQKFWDER